MTTVPGTGLCENCVHGHRLPGEPTGEMIQVDELPVYFRSAPEGATVPTEKTAIVLIYDVFGLPMPNSQIVLDELTKRLGVDGYVPDIFLGKPPVKYEDMQPFLPERTGHKKTWGDTFNFIWTLLKNFGGILPLITSPGQFDKRTTQFLEHLRAQGYTRIGLFGYCFGGKIVFDIATTDLATSVVILHPGQPNVKNAHKFKVPSSFACAEEDSGFKEKAKNETEAAVRRLEPGIPCEFVTYPGTTHGFALRPNLEIPETKAGYEGTLDQITAWFKKTL